MRGVLSNPLQVVGVLMWFAYSLDRSLLGNTNVLVTVKMQAGVKVQISSLKVVFMVTMHPISLNQ
jgi:hypothetical protein